MKFDTCLRPYIRRLNAESWLHAFFAAATAGVATALLTILVFQLIARPCLWGLVIGLSLGVASVTLFVTYFTVYRMSLKAAIRRIDEAGLQDRVSAMRELWGDTSYLATRQREDTLRRLKTVRPRAIRLKLPFLAALIILPVALVSIGAAALPPRVTPVEPDAPIYDEYAVENDEVHQLIEELYKKAEDSGADSYVKDRISDILQDMQDLLLNPDGSPREDLDDLERASELEDLLEQVQNLIRETLVSATIGRLLQTMPETAVLGDALLTREEADVNGAVEPLKGAMSGMDASLQATYLSLLSGDITGALEASEAWTGNDLVKALQAFADGLCGAGEQMEEGVNVQALLDEVFSNAKVDINAALEQEKANQGLLEDIRQELEDTIADIMEGEMASDKHINTDLKQEEDAENGDTPTSSLPSNSQSGGAASGGGANQTEEDEGFAIWDPISGAYVRMTADDLETYKQYLNDAIAGGNYSDEDVNYFNYYYELIKEELTKEN